MKKTTSISLTAIVCLLGLLWADCCFAKGKEVVVANQAVNLDSLYCKPEIFLVKVTEVNTKYNYCKGLIGNNVCYIEPINSDNSRLSTDYKPLQVGDYYLMALVYSNPEIIWWIDRKHRFNSCNTIAPTVKGKWITYYDIMSMTPDSFIAVNMAGSSIRPIIPEDLVERPQWTKFIFHPGIPSYKSLCKGFELGNENPKNYKSRVSVLCRVKNISDFSAYFHSGYREFIEEIEKHENSNCPPAEFSIPGKNSELPILRHPSLSNQASE